MSSSKSKKILLLSLLIFILIFSLNLKNAKAVGFGSGSVTIITTIEPALAMMLSDSALSFGNLIPGTPRRGPDGVTIEVSTNSANGYSISALDNGPDNGSALLHTDGNTRIPDFEAGIASPETWQNGVSKGLGSTIYSADTNKEPKWGNGNTYDSPNNKYAGIPQINTIIHTATGYKNAVDKTKIAFIIDAEPYQKMGIYSGSITLSAIANLH